VIAQTSSRLRATYGTGFKAPSLYQLYAPASVYGPIGNPDLEAETSRGWDAGVDQPFGDRLTAGITWFENRFDNMIDFENGYVNRAKAETRGLEVTTEWKATDDLTLRGAYTYTRAEDTDTGEALIRRPKHRATLDATYRLNAKTRTGVGLLYVGRRADKYFPADMSAGTDVTLPSYTVVNLNASYQLCSDLELYARVENLFNADYEEIKGYGTAGLSAYGGIKLSL
jgi:vitamin B12 transporter